MYISYFEMQETCSAIIASILHLPFATEEILTVNKLTHSVNSCNSLLYVKHLVISAVQQTDRPVRNASSDSERNENTRAHIIDVSEGVSIVLHVLHGPSQVSQLGICNFDLLGKTCLSIKSMHRYISSRMIH